MTNAQYRSFSGTYRVTVEFSLKYCDNSIKIESPSNVGYETDRNSAKGRQFVVTFTRKQNFFDKKKKLQNIHYYHCYISILDRFPIKIAFWVNIIQILQLKIQEKESYQILSCDQECSFVRNKNAKSQLFNSLCQATGKTTDLFD